MKRTGFTLIELLVLIAIIAVVMGIGFWAGRAKSDAGHKQEMVDRGFAHYEVDGSGKSRCVWDKPDVVTTTVTNDVVK